VRSAAKLPDGRVACRECSAAAVRGFEEYLRIVKAVKLILKTELAMEIRNPITYKLVSSVNEIWTKKELARTREMGKFVAKGGKEYIFILSDMPRGLCYETIAHELGHAWIHENVEPRPTPMLEEGFAEWVAAQVLRKKGYLNHLQKLEARDDLYGQGYQRFRDAEKRGGHRAVLRLLGKRSRSFGSL